MNSYELWDLVTSMDDVAGVKIVHSFKDLSDGLRGILFCESALITDPIKKLSASGQLCDDVIFVLEQISRM